MEKLEQVENKLDRISEDITEIKVIMERNTSSLEYHIKRTDIAEEKHDLLKTEVDYVMDHVKKVNWIFKIVAIVGAVVLFVVQILSLFK